MFYLNRLVKFYSNNTLLTFFLVASICLATGQSVNAQPGAQDLSFDAGFIAVAEIHDFLVQPDGKIVVSGFNLYAENADHIVARLHPDGSPDSSFVLVSVHATTLALQPDGKVLIGGAFTEISGAEHHRIARLNSDGSIDDTFTTGSGFGYATFVPGEGPRTMDIALQADGKILVVGSFNSFDGSMCPGGVVRLEQDGTLDNSFNVGSGLTADEIITGGFINRVSVQPDGKIVLSGLFGYFIGFNGDTDLSGLIRLNADGTIDDSFTTAAQQDLVLFPVNSFVLNDSNLLCLGELGGDGIETSYLPRFDNQGVYVSGFDTISQVNTSPAYFLDMDDGNKLIIGEPDLNEYNGQTFSILRLQENWEIDTLFDAGTGFEGSMGSAKAIQQADGKLLVSGSFEAYNGNSVFGLVRIYNDIAEMVCAISFEVVPDINQSDLLWVYVDYTGTGELSFLWSFGDGNFSNEMFPNHIYEEDGEYELCVTLTVMNLEEIVCTQTYCQMVSDDLTSGMVQHNSSTFRQNGFAINVVPLTSVSVVEIPRMFSLFPNPVKDELRIYSSQGIDHAVVEIIDLGGRQYYQEELSQIASNSPRVIDVAQLPAGIYLLVFRSQNGKESLRFVKQ